MAVLAYACLSTLALIAIVFRGLRPREDSGVEILHVQEGERFTVPIGMVAVITQLDLDSVSITDVGVFVDGQVRLSVNPARESTAVLVTACSLAEVRVHGGLMEENDAFCRGYLVPESRARTACE